MYLPSQLVSVPDPTICGLAKFSLDCFRVPNLMEELTLGVVLGVAGVSDVILVDDDAGRFDNVESVEHNRGLLAVRVEILWALR